MCFHLITLMKINQSTMLEIKKPWAEVQQQYFTTIAGYFGANSFVFLSNSLEYYAIDFFI